jgi:primase-like protein
VTAICRFPNGLIAAALAVIPNRDAGWEEWNRIGMAAWRATGGSDAGFEAFDGWSQKSAKYDAETTRERWQGYFSSPPTEIGAGTLFHLASQIVPRWFAAVDECREHAPEILRLTLLPQFEYEKTRQEAAASTADCKALKKAFRLRLAGRRHRCASANTRPRRPFVRDSPKSQSGCRTDRCR